MIKFEHKIMTTSELVASEYHLDRDYLLEISRRKNQKFCWKKNPTKSNSPLLWDTEELAKFIEKEKELYSKMSRATISA